MSLLQLQAFLGWNLVFHVLVLAFWAGMLMFAPKCLFGLHERLFKLDQAQLRRVHYSAIAFYKLSVFILVLAPYLALLMIG